MNVLLLCHGGIQEFGTFDLAWDQTVQYRGNFGSPLNYFAAGELVGALLDDPTISDKQLARGFRDHAYFAQEPLEGRGSFAPNLRLSGDNNVLCFFMDMNTRSWSRLGRGWRSDLGQVCRMIGRNGRNPFWLNLLCCTNLEDVDIPNLNARLEHRSWEDVLYN